MSFVSKECLDKKIVTIIIGIITELRPRLSFLRRVKFLLLWNRKTMSVRKNFPANAHPKLQVISKYIQIHNKVTQRSTENSPLSRILSTGTNNSNILMSCSHFSQHGSSMLRAAFFFFPLSLLSHCMDFSLSSSVYRSIPSKATSTSSSVLIHLATNLWSLHIPVAQPEATKFFLFDGVLLLGLVGFFFFFWCSVLFVFFNERGTLNK